MHTKRNKPSSNSLIKNGRFENPWLQRRKWAYLDLFKWLLFSKNRFRDEKKRPVEFQVESPDFPSLEARGGNFAVWLGHSTVLIRAGNRNIITDPVFWDVNFFMRRKTALPLDPAGLPRIDFVLISHGHLDHLNTRSVRFLKDRFDPVFITPSGFERYFRSNGITRTVSLDWHESHDAGGLRFICLPSQHWSKRTFFDTNSMLWCGFLIQDGQKKYVWIGDTGYYRGFKDIGEAHCPIDALFVPIGAYEPRWFMEKSHVNPEEALKIAGDLRAKSVIPIHWGTFDLTDEPLWLPIKHLQKIHDGKKDPPLKILNHGGSVFL